MSCGSCGLSLAELVEGMLGFGACGCGALASFQASKSASITIAAADGSPQSIPLEGIASVRLVAVRSLDGASLKLRMTSANGGAAQVIPFSGLMVMQLPGEGDQATALTLSGSGRVEYLIAGDLT